VDEVPALPLRCVAKTRYRQPDQSCLLEATEEGYRVTFDEPQRAVTPGQSVVFYQGDVCLGGGVIERTFRDLPADHHSSSVASA
jgi:Predicted tRNA(5-methylaminomethyl-2-thiouridylate) methyltransferase, contains the PP-loop ATPase domain